jgi:hypothetical protein
MLLRDSPKSSGRTPGSWPTALLLLPFDPVADAAGTQAWQSPALLPVQILSSRILERETWIQNNSLVPKLNSPILTFPR